MIYFTFYIYLFIMVLFIDRAKGLSAPILNNTECGNITHGQFRLYQNKFGDDETVVCSKKAEHYKWRFLNGSPSLGEAFDPAEDCTDIVDNLPNAKDDYYYVASQTGKAIKVWCDVRTDGGGFMLVGKQNHPSLWNVSFVSGTISPDGPSQWSRNFGNFSIQDFAVQISTSESFDTTRAHWYYKFNSARPFGNLLNINKGCSSVHSGIGDVQSVTDVLTGTVITTRFSCSKFGPHVSAQLGWGRMNQCIKHGCSAGYGYMSTAGVPFQLDTYGTFSYSTTSSLSGITHNSTAFVGCQNGKCCACFGPKGGRGHYCAPECRAQNGGTVLQNAYAWFWVRKRNPTRVWKRCMEFKKTTTKGDIETHVIDRNTGSTYQGSCSNNFPTFLNDGTLSVSDIAELGKLPLVPGVLSFVRNTKAVCVNDGNKWSPLAKEEEVDVLKRKITLLETENNRLKVKIRNEDNILKMKIARLENEDNLLKTKIRNEDNILKMKITRMENEVDPLKIKIRRLENELQKQAKRFTSLTVDGWTLIARFSNADGKNWMEDQGTWWYDTGFPHGIIGDASVNADMISEAFWSLKGSNFKITRSDDPRHTALLRTTGNCLGGQTFRAKMKSYGVYRRTNLWANNQCRGHCSVRYGGQYYSTQGFYFSDCDGNYQSRNKIGFWCAEGGDTGAVLMIGGGGSSGCWEADTDHGIGISENQGSFQGLYRYESDFGNSGTVPPTSSYSLNLWVY